MVKIKAKTKGELNLPGKNVHWLHVPGQIRDFPEGIASKILANESYEEVEETQVEPVVEPAEETSKKAKKSRYMGGERE